MSGVPTTTILVAPTPDDLFHLAGRRLAAAVGGALEARGRALVALAGGSTPAGFYTRLVRPDFAGRVDWGRVEFFWSDERCVPPDHPASNYRMARDTLLSHLAIRPGQVHRFPTEVRPPAMAAERYASELERVARDGEGAAGPGGAPDAGGVAAPPVFDLVLLGLGADAHTASLFPQSPLLDIRDRWAAATSPPGELPRLTLTLPVLNAARQVHFLVTGEAKAKAVRRVLAANAEPGPDAPATLVRPVSGRLTWLLDAAAAARLDD